MFDSFGYQIIKFNFDKLKIRRNDFNLATVSMEWKVGFLKSLDSWLDRCSTRLKIHSFKNPLEANKSQSTFIFLHYKKTLSSKLNGCNRISWPTYVMTNYFFSSNVNRRIKELKRKRQVSFRSISLSQGVPRPAQNKNIASKFPISNILSFLQDEICGTKKRKSSWKA